MGIKKTHICITYIVLKITSILSSKSITLIITEMWQMYTIQLYCYKINKQTRIMKIKQNITSEKCLLPPPLLAEISSDIVLLPVHSNISITIPKYRNETMCPFLSDIIIKHKKKTIQILEYIFISLQYMKGITQVCKCPQYIPSRPDSAPFPNPR